MTPVNLLSRSVLLLLLVVCTTTANAQTPNPIPPAFTGPTLNYARTWIPTAPEQNPTNLPVRPLTDVKQITNYADGFGRPLQSVAKNASPAGNDMVSVNYYDTLTGNEIFHYLPFTSNVATSGDITNDGNFKLDAFQQQTAFYNTYLGGQPNETNIGTGGSNWAYAQTNYEASPLDRVLNNYAPGHGWVGSGGTSTPHNTQKQFLTNTAIDSVQIWNMPAWSLSNSELDSTIIPADRGMYAAGVLYKTILTNEQGLQTIEFNDKYGQTILIKQQFQSSPTPYTAFDNGTGKGHTGWLCTYYVYDDHGSIRFVITPNVVTQMNAGNSWVVSQSLADELCYRFEYDQFGNMIVKKIPGTPSGTTGEIWMVYDQRHRLVMQQDGNMRAAKQWLYIQYDNLDRPIAQGLITDPTYYTNLSYHTSNADTLGNNTSGVSAWPVLTSYTSELLSQIFYDNYSKIPGTLPQTMDNTTNGDANPSFTTSYNVTPIYAQPLTQSPMLQGLTTGTNAEVMGSNQGQYIPTVLFYDEKARVIQTETINYTHGKDIGTIQYDWSGKPLTTLMSQGYSSSVNPQTHNVITALNYDAAGRPIRVIKTVNSIVNSVAVNSATDTTSTIQYDELSRILKKTLGANLESLTFGYNVRGWLLGINQGYISGSSSNYFGLELGYDKTTSVAPGNAYLYPSFTGGIAGTAWKSKGDGINRKYDLSYDNTGRLTGSAFLQNTTGTSWDNSFLDFSVSNMTYDANGNLTAMKQMGFAQGGSKPIDQLALHYVNGAGNSNRLVYTNDTANVTNSSLGDFHFPGSPKTTSSVDYTYDNNANTTADTNRAIRRVSYYPYPNLPDTITTPKGTIHYIYDASGTKLQKQVIENGLTINGNPTTLTTTSNYVGGSEYKTVFYSSSALTSLNYTDVLQFFSTEDGRIRFKPAMGTVAAQFVHDYLIRDHLGNVRVGITDESQQDDYPAATGETATVTVGGVNSTAQTYESQFYSFNPSDFVATTSLPSWFASMPNSIYLNENGHGMPVNNDPFSQTADTSKKVFQLSGNTTNNPTGDRFGLGITLKVMAGDVVNIYGTSFWNNTGNIPPGNYPVSAVLSSLLGAFGGSTAVTSTLSHSALDGSPFNTATNTPTATMLTPMLNSDTTQPGTQAPYAGISYIVFDDQFRPQGTVVGFDPVSTSSQSIKNHSFPVSIPRDGYLFVYVSNQSSINVYFDNLQVVQTRGQLLEETHYYPVGLAMAGISDRAWNKQPNYFHYQGKEMQDEEWNDGSGLEEYDFGARYYDPQIGRWGKPDPADQFASPYTGMGNNWMNGVDPDGKKVNWQAVLDVGIIVASAVAAAFTDGLTLEIESPWLFGAEIAVGGYLGASWESGSLDPGKWNKNWWKGMITGELIAASLAVAGEEAFGPVTSSTVQVNGVATVVQEDALSQSIGAGAANIVENSANTVLTNLAQSELKDQLTKNSNLTFSDAYSATLSGAILGAFKGWNPTSPLTEEDGSTFTGLGLRLPAGPDESALSSYGRKALYNLIATSGGSLLGNGFKDMNLFTSVNIPIGWLPINLTVGKGQALFQGMNNAGAFGPLLNPGMTLGLTDLFGSAYSNLIGSYSGLMSNFVGQFALDWWK